MSHGILVIEDETILAKNIKTYLERHDYEVRVAENGETGLEQFEEFRPDLVLLDFRLPGLDGLEVLERIRALESDIKVILITAHGNVQVAVEAMKAGAYDYLAKPLVLSELKILVDKAVGQERLEGTLSYYQEREAVKGGLASLIGESQPIRDMSSRIRQILEVEESLTDGDPPCMLITGETGTGKDLVARAIHAEGSRRDNPFVEVDCTSIPTHLVESELFGHERGAFTDAKERKRGLVEAAEGGTLFLDEIGDVETAVQAKLLRLLEEKVVRRVGGLRDRKVNVRIIAATNRPLEQLVQTGQFRSDLYFRLRVVVIHLPPLRERGDDILLLAEHFLEVQGRRYGKTALRFSDDAKRLLAAHEWPGNVRELRNLVEQAVLLARDAVIDRDLLPIAPATQLAPVAVGGSDEGAAFSLPAQGVDLEAVERDLVVQALERSAWNVTRAAKLLGLSRDTLRYRVDKFQLREARRRV